MRKRNSLSCLLCGLPGPPLRLAQAPAFVPFVRCVAVAFSGGPSRSSPARLVRPSQGASVGPSSGAGSGFPGAVVPQVSRSGVRPPGGTGFGLSAGQLAMTLLPGSSCPHARPQPVLSFPLCPASPGLAGLSPPGRPINLPVGAVRYPHPGQPPGASTMAIASQIRAFLACS